MTTINPQKQNLKQLEEDSWTSTYLPVICAGTLMAIVLFLAISCTKKSETSAKIAPPTQPAATQPANPSTVAAAVPAAPKKVKKHRPANATYVNSDYGVSFSYPRKYSLQAGTKQNESPLPTNFSKPGAVQVATVDMPDDSYPGTDFSSALLNLSVMPATTADECAQFSAGSKDAGAVKPNVMKMGSNEFSEFEQINGEGDRKSDLKYFHFSKNGACYEFALGVQTVTKDDSELAQVDRGKVFRQLEKILTTARIKELQPVETENADKAITPAPGTKAPELVVSDAKAGDAKVDASTQKAEVVTPEQK